MVATHRTNASSQLATSLAAVGCAVTMACGAQIPAPSHPCLRLALGGELVGNLSGDSSVASHDAGVAAESAPIAAGLPAGDTGGVFDWGDCGEHFGAGDFRGATCDQLDARASRKT